MFKNVILALARALLLLSGSFLVALYLYPVGSRLTRAAGLVLLVIFWACLILLFWRWRRVRYSLLAATALLAGFLALPARAGPGVAVLRTEYADAMRRYDGVNYYWGGESWRGIDCSGLIRRGLIDAQFWRGMRTFDGGLVRSALGLWWNDTTAKVLGEAKPGLTRHLLETPSINALDHSTLVPGDLAVTRNGIHILAYLGDKTWIEADPAEGRVMTVTAPSKDNAWLNNPVNIVRWEALRD